MDKRVIKLSRVLFILMIVILIAMPICMLINTEAGADESTQTIVEYDNDYVFFVLEDSKTPLAAAPTTNSIAEYTQLSVMLAFIAIFALGYTVWYLIIKHNTQMLVSVSPIRLRQDLVESSSFFHPIRSYRASKEAEYSVTQKYFNFI